MYYKLWTCLQRADVDACTGVCGFAFQGRPWLPCFTEGFPSTVTFLMLFSKYQMETSILCRVVLYRMRVGSQPGSKVKALKILLNIKSKYTLNTRVTVKHTHTDSYIMITRIYFVTCLTCSGSQLSVRLLSSLKTTKQKNPRMLLLLTAPLQQQEHDLF